MSVTLFRWNVQSINNRTREIDFSQIIYDNRVNPSREGCACCFTRHRTSIVSVIHDASLFVYILEAYPRCSNLPMIYIRKLASFTRQGRQIGLENPFSVSGRPKAFSFSPGACSLVSACTFQMQVVSLQSKVIRIYSDCGRRLLLGPRCGSWMKSNSNCRFILLRNSHEAFGRFTDFPAPNIGGNNKKEKHFHSRSSEKTFAMCMASEIKKASSKNNISVARSLSLATVVLPEGILRNIPFATSIKWSSVEVALFGDLTFSKEFSNYSWTSWLM